MKRILALGAHYDDIEVGIAGTLYQYSLKDYEIYFAITSSDEFRTGDVDTRYNEQLQSMKLLNVPKNNLLTFKCVDNESDIVGVLDKIQPDILFCQHENDTHQDHRRCSSIGRAVGRKKYITTLFYSGGSTYDFYPNLFHIINFDKKLEILNTFYSQLEMQAVRSDIIQKRAAYWGSLVSDEDCYAEGFIVKKMRLVI